ncbi:hypothetical protein ARTHRO9V_280384 [Arthrobacter sp. 9V]|nr:hypothetical protein ARTHRO9V_280384 [Arthrobacter sp. 9V]
MSVVIFFRVYVVKDIAIDQWLHMAGSI